MRPILFSFITIFTIYIHSINAQTSDKTKVDSVFTSHFNILETELNLLTERCSNKEIDSLQKRKLLEMENYAGNKTIHHIDFNKAYKFMVTMTKIHSSPQKVICLNDLIEKWKNWYTAHKTFLIWQEHIQSVVLLPFSKEAEAGGYFQHETLGVLNTGD